MHSDSSDNGLGPQTLTTMLQQRVLQFPDRDAFVFERDARTLAITGVVMILVLGMMARAQVRHWHDPPALWSHVIAVTERNHVAHWMWGIYEWKAGNQVHAERLMRTAQRLNPAEAFYVSRLGRMLLDAGRKFAALREFDRLLHAPLATTNLLTTTGITTLRLVGPEVAIPYLQRAVEVAQDSASGAAARFYLWVARASADDDAGARHALQDILTTKRTHVGAFCVEAVVLMRQLAGFDIGWARYVSVVDEQCGVKPPHGSR